MIGLISIVLLSGCLEATKSDEASGNPDLYLDVPDGSDLDAGFLGASLEEGATTFIVTFDFTKEAKRSLERSYCDLSISHNITHTLTIDPRNHIKPPKILEDGSRTLRLSVPYEDIHVLTWFPVVKVSCTVRLSEHGKINTEAGVFTWSTPPEVGNPDFAFGVGPFSDSEIEFYPEPCHVTASRPGEDEGPEKICFPENQIEAVTFWQNETAIFLMARMESEPLESAKLKWNYPGQPDGPRRPSHSITYDFSSDSARDKDGDLVQSNKSGSTVMLTIPHEMLSNRMHDNFVEFSVFLFSDQDAWLYLSGFDPPPYLLH